MKPLYVILLCLCSQYLAAQLYDKTWVCGSYAGRVTFNDNGTIDTSSFHPFVNTLVNIVSICDKDGELQFFTEGVNVYSANGIRMFNGFQLADNLVNQEYGHGFPDCQNVLVLPKRNNEYYIIYQSQEDFSFANEPWYYTNRLYYSVVDMELDGGLGDVSQKRVQVNDNKFMDGKMTACQHANGRDWWLVQRRYNTNGYFIYLVTAEGITLHREQFIGAVSQEPDAVGQSAFSPDGNKYASITGKSPMIILDFDRCEGVFSNPQKVDIPIDTFIFYGQTKIIGGGGNGLCFSPNNRFIYVNSLYILRQYDLNEISIDSSEQVVFLWTDSHEQLGKFDQMQLGSNGKMYLANYTGFTYALHAINNPDEKGLACNFEKWGLPIATNNAFSIPNIVHYRMGALIGSACDTITTGIADIDIDSKVRLYPNPAKDIVQIDLTSYNHYNPNNYLFLYNTEGKLMQQVPVSYLSAQMDVSSLPAGAYQWAFGTVNKIAAKGSLTVVK
ncbi:MAG: hypothetical protein JST49_03355 [Bacteroidetes bacterium]|nr:hypothetical protein [Bacteroidota bacterium]